MQEDNQVSRKVLEIVRLKGPVIPTQISSEIGTSSLLASAILSELVSNRTLKISSVKVGGTPLYYAPGQEERLQNYTKYLHEKELKAYDLLKSEKILRDSKLEPVIRVALRNIKDFAVPVSVSDSGNSELFWKWYLLPNGEAEKLIRNMLQKGEESPVSAEKESASEVPETGVKPKSEPGHSGSETSVKTSGNENIQETLEPNSLPAAPKKKTPVQKTKTGEFAKKVAEYFLQNRIEIIQKLEGSKRSEEEFIISVPTPVGGVKYYARAKDKKTCNEGDLSMAFVQGQNRKLPVLFITSGKITKNAGEMLQKEFSGMSLKEL